MPFKKSELDPVQNCITQALQIIRDLPPGPLEVEQIRTRVYGHLYHAANEILNANYIRYEEKEAKQPKVAQRDPEGKKALLDAFQEALKKDLGLV